MHTIYTTILMARDYLKAVGECQPKDTEDFVVNSLPEVLESVQETIDNFCLDNNEKQVEYIERGGLRCPACGSESVEAYDQIGHEGGTFQECGCTTCAASWVDNYILVGYDRLVHGVPQA